MAKALQFELAGRLFESEPVKLDRKKIYGHKEIAAFDADGNECTQCQLDAAGELLIPSGAVKIVSLDEDGNSIERDEMILTDAQGNSPENHPSSFEAPLVLNETVSDETFLDHIWKAVYQISNPELAEAVGDNIYSFPFSFRGGHTLDEGFLLAADGACFLFSGEKAEFPLLDAPDAGVLEDEEENNEDDLLEFDLM